MKTVKTECPCCKGAKVLTMHAPIGENGELVVFVGEVECTHCMGKGVIEVEVEDDEGS